MKKLIVLLLVVSIFSCTRKDDYSDFISSDSIESDIVFFPEETFFGQSAPKKPALKLRLETTEIFPCINFILSTTESTRGNELIIRFNEIIRPTGCLTAIGPASKYIDLHEDITEITFLNGDLIDKYSVNISKEKVSINQIESNFTTALHNKTFRYPEDSFAFVCGTNTDNTHIYDDFLAILNEKPTWFIPFEFNGEGRIPYPESSGGSWVDHPSKFYKYSSEAAFNNLEEMLKDFRTENIPRNSGVSIAIYGWNDVSFFGY